LMTPTRLMARTVTRVAVRRSDTGKIAASPGSTVEVHPVSDRTCTSHCHGVAGPTVLNTTVAVPLRSVSRNAGVGGAGAASQLDAGTIAICAYGPCMSESFMPP